MCPTKKVFNCGSIVASTGNPIESPFKTAGIEPTQGSQTPPPKNCRLEQLFKPGTLKVLHNPKTDQCNHEGSIGFYGHPLRGNSWITFCNACDGRWEGIPK